MKRDIESLEKLRKTFLENREAGFIQMHHVRMIRSGSYHHIDAHLVLPEFWTVEEVHERLEKFEKKIIKNYSGSGEMNFHLDPCRRAYCSVCDLKDCPVRKEKFTGYYQFSLKEMYDLHEPAPFRFKGTREEDDDV